MSKMQSKELNIRLTKLSALLLDLVFLNWTKDRKPHQTLKEFKECFISFLKKKSCFGHKYTSSIFLSGHAQSTDKGCKLYKRKWLDVQHHKNIVA